MLTMLRRFLWDEAYAAQFIRVLVNGIGIMLITGVISLNDLGESAGKFGWYLGIACQAAAVFFRAGDKNQAPVA